MDRNGVEVYKLAKKEGSQYPANLTEKVWSIKDSLHAKQNTVFLRDIAVIPSGKDSDILGSQSQRRIRFLLLGHDHGASHIINSVLASR